MRRCGALRRSAAAGLCPSSGEEALRLYPPAGFLTRKAARDDDTGPYFIPKGANLMLPIYAVQRHDLLWDAPSAFDPDRFDVAHAARRHRYAFLPFGAGRASASGRRWR
ncbi:cytochrome P450 [Rhodovulum iodosum]|nr:cytochrome P450 [Rhodovulum robiginosum]